MMQNEKYVFTYKDPETLKPFYIGMGEGQRAWGFTMPSVLKQNETDMPKLVDKIRDLEKRNLKPIIEFLVQNVSAQDAREIRSGILAEYGIVSEGGMFTNQSKYDYAYERNYRLEDFKSVPAVRDKTAKFHNVYFIRCPKTNMVRYVGSGKQERAYHHLRPCWWKHPERSKMYPELYSWIRNTIERGAKPVIEIVHSKLTKDKAMEIESKYISKYQLTRLGGSLFNKINDEGPGKGTKWITDGLTNKRIYRDEPIPHGWLLGRKPRRQGRKETLAA